MKPFKSFLRCAYAYSGSSGQKYPYIKCTHKSLRTNGLINLMQSKILNFYFSNFAKILTYKFILPAVRPEGFAKHLYAKQIVSKDCPEGRNGPRYL